MIGNCDCLAKAKVARNLHRYSGDFTLVNNKIKKTYLHA